MSLRKVDFTQSGGGDSNKGSVNINWKNTNNTLLESSCVAATPSCSPRKVNASMQEASSVVQQMRETLEQLQVSLRSSREDEAMLLKSHAYMRHRIMLLSTSLERATACNRSLTDTLLSSPERCTPLGTTSDTGESAKQGGDSSLLLVHRSVQTHEVTICGSRCPCTCHNISGGLWKSNHDTNRDCSHDDVHVENPSQERGEGDSNDKRVEQLSRALLQTKKALRARERAVIDICVKFLHMRRRRQLQARREAELLRVVRCLRTVLACATQTLLRATHTLDQERPEHSSLPPLSPSSADSPIPQERSDSPSRSTPPPAPSFERRRRHPSRRILRPSKRTVRVNESPSESSISTSHVGSSSMDYAGPCVNSPYFKLPQLRTYSSPYSSSSSTSSPFTRRFTFPRFKKFARPYVFSWRTRLSSLSAPYKRLFKSRSLYSCPSSSSRTLSSSPSSLRSASLSSKQTSSLMSHTQSEHSDVSLFSPRIELLSDSSDRRILEYFTSLGSSANFVSKSDPLIISEYSVNEHDHLKPLPKPSGSLSTKNFVTPREFINAENTPSRQPDIEIQDV